MIVPHTFSMGDEKQRGNIIENEVNHNQNCCLNLKFYSMEFSKDLLLFLDVTKFDKMRFFEYTYL